MESAWLLEAIGYAGSLLVAVSLMMRSILRLRVINLIGAALFVVYGLLIRAYPIAAVNFFIVLIDLYYLREIASIEEYFTLLEVPFESRYLHHFLHFYRAEIRRFIPGFRDDLSPRHLFLFILRDMVPAGLFIAERVEPHALLIRLDFVIPSYRDFKIGRFLYADRASFFRERGFNRVYSEPGNKTHNAYLERMGFNLDDSLGRPLYCLTLDAV
ncbi:MAG: GNAT family N-acetyltransferase [Candidatus Promineifilaceae bacterium]|nr:GNAT family N-acetyltransferase [Candidatus Promineifilaceae bacterium]